MALDTYANLKLAIADYLDRDDLTSQIDDFIDIAESAHRDEVRFRELLTRASITIADGDRTEPLPADFAQVKYIRLINPQTTTWSRYYLPTLIQLSEHELTEKASLTDGPPKYFCINEQIEFDVAADQEYTGELLYYKTMTALSDSNPSNELLVRGAELYLYGALKATAPFLMNDERLNIWANLYQEALERLNRAERTDRRSGPQIARVKGV